MDNKQGTVIGLGVMALCSLYYFYHQSDVQRKQLKSKKNQLKNAIKLYQQKKSPLDWGQKNSKKQKIYIQNLFITNTNQYTYNQILRDQRINEKLVKDQFLQNQSGGSFQGKYKNNEVRIELKKCTLDQDIINNQQRKQIIFEQNKNKKVQLYTIHSSLNPLSSLALFGSITYSLQQKRWIIFPQIMVKLGEKSQFTKQLISSFWQDKIYHCTFKKIAIGFTMCIATYLFIYKPIKSIWLRYRAKFKDLGQFQLNFFKIKDNYNARLSSALNCQICHSNIISFIYECGHLVSCSNCHESNDPKKCPICKVQSKKYCKIYI